MLRDDKTFLRWAGSKKRLVPKLLKYFDTDYDRYIEPFMGSAAVFFALAPKRAILSDLNCDLVNTFIAVRDHPRAVYNAFSKFPVTKEDFYNVRAMDIEKLNSVKRAARFIYLNRFCFNGLYRTNKLGRFNVPYSPVKSGNLPSKANVCDVAKSLKSVELLSGDFEVTLNLARRGDFVYLDPPYLIKKRRIFNEYLPNSFNRNDLDRLSIQLQKLNTRGVKFLLSYAFCKEGLQLSRGWYVQRVQTQRNISGFAKFRRKALELLISNVEVKI